MSRRSGNGAKPPTVGRGQYTSVDRDRALKLSRSGPPKQPTTREVRIPIKEATAKNLLALNDAVIRHQNGLAQAEQRMLDNLRPLFTENGITVGRCKEVTESEPYELVVLVEDGYGER